MCCRRRHLQIRRYQVKRHSHETRHSQHTKAAESEKSKGVPEYRSWCIRSTAMVLGARKSVCVSAHVRTHIQPHTLSHTHKHTRARARHTQAHTHTHTHTHIIYLIALLWNLDHPGTNMCVSCVRWKEEGGTRLACI